MGECAVYFYKITATSQFYEGLNSSIAINSALSSIKAL